MLNDDVDDICRVLMYDNVEILPAELLWSFNMPVLTMYPAILFSVCIIVSIKLTECVLRRTKPGIYAQFADSPMDTRKVTIYVVSPLLFTYLLAILLCDIAWRDTEVLSGDECDLVHNEESTQDSSSSSSSSSTD